MSRSRILASVAVLGIGLAACVADAPDRSPVAVPEAVAGGTVTVAIDRPGSVDPANAYDPDAELVARTMCDTLLTTDPVTGALAPGLAESWLVTDEGSRIVLRLRDDAVFSNGEPVRTRDVVASLSRAAAPGFAGELADLLRPIAGWDELRGLVATDVVRHTRELAGVAAVGDRTVQITLRAPRADFVTVLTHPVSAPVSTEAATADPAAFAAQPVCAGPYVLDEPWSRTADRFRLVRSAHHVPGGGSATSGGAGWADEIVFRVIGEQPVPEEVTGGHTRPDADEQAPAPEVAAPSLRGLDVAPVGAGMRAQVDALPAFSVLEVAGPGLDLVGLPVAPGNPEHARAIRQALSLALDRTAVAAAMGSSRAPATGFLPPTVGPAYRPDACGTAPASPDADAARRALAEAGAQLSSLRLVTTGEFRNAELARAVARSWQEVLDVPVEVEVVAWTELLRRAERVTGFDAAFRTSWSSAVPSAHAYLHPLGHSAAIGTTNWSRFSDPTVDEALDDGLSTAIDRDDLVLEARRVEDLLCRELPLIPVVREVRAWAVRTPAVASARHDGVLLDRATALPRLRDLYVRR